MRVNTNVDEADVGRIRPDQSARFRVDAFPTEEFVGRVSQIRLQPVVQQNVVTYSTVVEVSNPQYKLKPGMTATISIEIARREHVLRVPNAALRFRPTEEMFTALNQPLPPDLQRGPGGEMTQRRAGNPDAAGGGGQSGGGGPGGPGGRRNRGGQGGGGAGAPAPGGTNGAAGVNATNGAAGRGAATDANAHRDNASAAAKPPVAATAQGSKAQTIDALFAPLPIEESSGRVWLFDADQMRAVRLRLGITDGTVTEIRNGEVTANADVITSITLPASSQTRGTGGATGNPLMGNQQRPGQNRNPGGGAGGRGGGGR
jgi:HlyD family secretion protein